MGPTHPALTGNRSDCAVQRCHEMASPATCEGSLFQHPSQSNKKGPPKGSPFFMEELAISCLLTNQRSCCPSWQTSSCRHLQMRSWNSNQQLLILSTTHPSHRSMQKLRQTCCSMSRQQPCPCRKNRSWHQSKLKHPQTCCSMSQQQPCPCCMMPFQWPNKQACSRLWRLFAPFWPSCQQELQWIGQTQQKQRMRMHRERGTFS